MHLYLYIMSIAIIIFLFMVFLIIVLLSCKHFLWKNNFWSQRNINGPKLIQTFVNDIRQTFKYMHSSELSKIYYHQYENEKVIGTFRWSQPTLIVRDINLIKDILIRDFSVFCNRKSQFHKIDLLDRHIFNLPKSDWKPLKTTLSSSFTNVKISATFDIISNITDEFLLFLEDNIKNSNPVDIYPLLFKFTTKIIGYYGFKLEMDELSDKVTDFAHVHRQRLDPSYFQSMQKYLHQFLSYLKTNKKELFYFKLVKDVENHRRMENTKIDDYIGKLINLLHDRENTADKYYYMAAQAYVFFTAGSEGIAISISNALFEIANNVHIENELRKEILNIFNKKKNKELNINEITSMKYLDKVYQETLRKYPLRDIIRINEREYTFRDTNITIPVNTNIIIPHYAINRDKNIYLNPEIFDPKRFENSINRLHYFPFGDGPRKCIGGKFASYIFKICIIKILLKFKISNMKTQRNKNNPYKVFLYPKGGIILQFQKL